MDQCHKRRAGIANPLGWTVRDKNLTGAKDFIYSIHIPTSPGTHIASSIMSVGAFPRGAWR